MKTNFIIRLKNILWADIIWPASGSAGYIEYHGILCERHYGIYFARIAVDIMFWFDDEGVEKEKGKLNELLAGISEVLQRKS